MNEIKINTKEIESIWEKDNLCFVKMKSGKVWICDKIITRPKKELFRELGFGYSENDIGTAIMETSFYIEKSKNVFVTIPLSKKGKSE